VCGLCVFFSFVVECCVVDCDCDVLVEVECEFEICRGVIV